MNKKIIREEDLEAFGNYLVEAEKSGNTVSKELRDVRTFLRYISDNPVTKKDILEYKAELQEKYMPRSVNSMLASLNSFFTFKGWHGLKVKGMKLQPEAFCPEKKNLTRSDYEKLCLAAEKRGNEKAGLLLQTIAGTGIRVSEIRYITVEACEKGYASVTNKGKTRTVLIPGKLKKKLLRYSAEQKILSGSVFLSKNGNPIDRIAIWRLLKSLAAEAHVNPEKVFPHNLRHLFARMFYTISRDIAKLADVLGHSSINTTRIYIATPENEHRRYLEKMKMIS